MQTRKRYIDVDLRPGMHLIECAFAVTDNLIERSVDVSLPLILEVRKVQALGQRSVGIVVVVGLPLAQKVIDGLVSGAEFAPNLRFVHVVEDHPKLFSRKDLFIGRHSFENAHIVRFPGEELPRVQG